MWLVAAGPLAIPDSHLEKRGSKDCKKPEWCKDGVQRRVESKQHEMEFAETLPEPPWFR